MLIRDSVWEEIRKEFDEAEKKELRFNVTGRVICPAGNIIDSDALNPVLRVKIRRLTGQLMGLNDV